MKPQDFTTEDTERKYFRCSKNSVNSVIKTSPKEFPLKEVTERIISCAIEVHSTLGPGLLESIYEEALAHEFALRGMSTQRRQNFLLTYFKLNVFSVFSVVNFGTTFCCKRRRKRSFLFSFVK